MNEKLDSTRKNGVWKLVCRTAGMKVVRCKWIFKRKTDAEEKIESLKLDLWPKGIFKSWELTIRKLSPRL